MFDRIVRLSVVALAGICLSASDVMACPMCKFAMETDDPKPRAYMYSILFMLIAIGTVAGGVVGLIYWITRNEQAALEAAGYQHLFENGVSEQARSRT